MVDAREWQVERQVALMSVIWAAARLDLDADDAHKYVVLPRGRWGTRSEALDAIPELMAGPRPVGLAAVPDRLNWYTEPERLAVGIATWQMTPQDRQYWEARARRQPSNRLRRHTGQRHVRPARP
jgi:hypothetical protein